MAEEQQLRVVAASVRSARQAIQTATERRAAAVAAARNLAEAAHVAERAEQDAARAAASAGIHRLAAARLTTPQIAELCEIPPEEVQHLQTDDAIGQSRYPTGSPGTAP